MLVPAVGMLRRAGQGSGALGSPLVGASGADLEAVLGRILHLVRGGLIQPSKKAYCQDEAARLVREVEETEHDLSAKQAFQEQLRVKEAQCGCCCKEYHDIQMALISARKSVEYLEGRRENLQKQVEALQGWCV
mmetsp:Transcript_83847/g.242437  ORF Transcript_83847/g.242437 Transcript_83847/m.242437 type:complete len:134 (+) Transcript_83847:87-488(+)